MGGNLDEGVGALNWGARTPLPTVLQIKPELNAPFFRIFWDIF